MKYLTLCAMLLSFLNVDAQYNSAVKVYLNVHTTPVQNAATGKYLGISQRTTVRDILQPSLSYMTINKRKSYHEMELSRLDIRQSETDIQITNVFTGEKTYQRAQRVTETFIALRYEYGITFFKKKNWRVTPSVGLSGMPYYHRYDVAPYLTSDYPSYTAAAGVRTFLVPRVNISISKRMFIDLNVPVCVMDMAVAYQKISNPNLSAGAQKYSTADFAMLPSYLSARAGLAMRF